MRGSGFEAVQKRYVQKYAQSYSMELLVGIWAVSWNAECAGASVRGDAGRIERRCHEL